MTVYKPKESPYYQFDFQRGGRRFCGSTKRLSRTEAEEVEQAEIERAEREVYAARAAAMASPDSRMLLPRHVVRDPLRSGGWKYKFIVPTKARKAGCPMRNEPLGSDHDAAVARAENVLLPAFDAWRAEAVPPAERSSTGASSEFPGPEIGVYLLMLKGKVVYVGSSLRMPKRVLQHRQNGRSFDQAFYIATERGQHTKLEIELIRSIDPIQNRIGRRASPEPRTEGENLHRQGFDS